MGALGTTGTTMDKGGGKISYKDPSHMSVWLETALEKEKEKYEKTPVVPDIAPEHVAAQGWAYVVVGYSLLELGFKAVLHVREKVVPHQHSLSKLFGLLDETDKTLLSEAYMDYRNSIGGLRGRYPFRSLDQFLTNLDGDKNARGGHLGSFDWRYFPIEDARSAKIPLVSVDYMHEVILALVRLVSHGLDGGRPPSAGTLSERRYEDRCNGPHEAWLAVQLKQPDRRQLGERIEILWGPDQTGRYDVCQFHGDRRVTICQRALPDGCEWADRRSEIKPRRAE